MGPSKSAEIVVYRLRNSGLSKPSFGTPDEVVRWHGALQAQDYSPSAWSIAQRTTGLVQDDVDAALASGAIVRTHALRPTWHFVARDDLRWLLALTGPRVHQSSASRYRELGLDARTLARCEKAIASALSGGGRMSRNDIGALLERKRIDPAGQRLPHILMHCELEAVICSGGLDGKQQTYALVDTRIPKGRSLDRDAALIELTRRYLSSHGPATIKDLAWWASLKVADIRQALGELGPEVASASVDGVDFWWIARDEPVRKRKTATLLLQQYDELVVGYTESRFFGDPRAEEARASWKERSRPTGVLLIDGAIKGHWRRATGANSVRVEVSFYERPSESEGRALKGAVKELGRFLDRPAILTIL